MKILDDTQSSNQSRQLRGNRKCSPTPPAPTIKLQSCFNHQFSPSCLSHNPVLQATSQPQFPHNLTNPDTILDPTATPLQLLNKRAGVYRTRTPRWHACQRIAPGMHHHQSKWILLQSGQVGLQYLSSPLLANPISCRPGLVHSKANRAILVTQSVRNPSGRIGGRI